MLRSSLHWPAAALALWLAAISFVFAPLLAYQSSPGGPGHPPSVWPDRPPPARPQVLLFVHPRCPCTVATVAEFARLAPRLAPQARRTAYVYEPPDAPADWSHGAVVAGLVEIPGLELIPDPAATVARRFGIRTSGHVLAYNARGALTFSGGITFARGHEGRCDWQERLIAAVERTEDCVGSPVYGCPLWDGPVAEGG